MNCIFNAIINELFISPSYVFLLVYRNKTLFRMLIVYPATFLNLLILVESFVVVVVQLPCSV